MSGDSGNRWERWRAQVTRQHAVRKGRTLGLMLLGALAVGNADCAQERDPINRVQPMAVNKHFFVGRDLVDGTDDPQFYSNNYVVDAPPSQGMVPVGTYDEVDRIHWEITPDLLIARKAYDYVTNADGRGIGGRTPNGLIVAAYRITDQFDIRNDYNPTTGEPLNVVVENRSDRPSYQREFMRVDWSQNLVDNPDWSWLFYGALFGDLSFQPARWTVEDPQSQFAPNLCEAMLPAADVPDASRGQLGDAVSVNVNGAQTSMVHALYGWQSTCPSRFRVNPSNARYVDPVSDTGYFDVTSKWLVSPEMSDTFGFPLPTCYIYNLFTGSDTYDCNPQETTIRTSFRRVTDRDFEPLEKTRVPHELVGGPVATRAGFDQNYGTTDANFHRYAMIHNVWMQSHTAQTCQARPQDVAGPANECNGTPGSHCDTVVGRCTIPYAQRKVRPIVYYVNPEMPAEFQDHMERDVAGVLEYRMPTAEERTSRPARTGNGSNWYFVTGATEQLVNTWDLAVRRGLASAREVECRRGGTAREACHSRFFDATPVAQEDGAFLGDSPKAAPTGAEPVDRGVVVCHNPVAATDHRACREVGYSVRLGDIRYNHITYWSGNSRAPFGGIAHWGYDPLTGEVISNGATNMARSVEYAAGQQRDWIRLIMHELDPEAESLTVEEYTNNAPGAVLAQFLRNPGTTRLGSIDNSTRLSHDELRERAERLSLAADGQRLASEMPDFGNNLREGIRAYQQITRDMVPIAQDPSGNGMRYHVQASQLARQLQNTQYEADLLDPNTLRLMGAQGITGLSDDMLNRASPLRLMDPETINNMRDELMHRAEARGFCFQDAGAPPAVGSDDLQGVARWFLNKYRGLTMEARRTRILQDLRIDAYKGIALHEIGHSIGLYHLPVSSYDAMNYNPGYWQLRTKNNTAQQACSRCTMMGTRVVCSNSRAADRNADNCMGPRYLDPATDEEMGVRPVDAGNHHAGINYFGNTSTMEYQWERFGETVGAGAYDFYAMGYLYGRVLETHDAAAMPAEEQRRFAPRLQSQLSEKDYIYWNDPAFGPSTEDPTFGAPVHYTELARQLQVFDPSRCRDATPAELERYRWRLVDGKICSHAPRDHAAVRDFETSPEYFRGEAPEATGTEDDTPYWRVREGAPGDMAGNVRWRYRVSWDRGTGYPHINYFDQGADIYEVTHSIMRKYDLLYPSMYFRRGQREWASWGVSQGVSSRMFKLVRGYHWNVSRDIALYKGFYNDATFAALSQSEGFLQPSLAVNNDIFNFFAGVMTRPAVGDYSVETNAEFFTINGATPETRAASINVWNTDVVRGTPRFSVGLVNGRYIDDDYNNRMGGSLDYLSYQNREGTSLEKTFATIMLMDSRPTFSSITRHLYLDGRDFLVNFNTDFPDATRRLLGGLMAEDWPTVGMWAPNAASGSDTEVSPRQLDMGAATMARPAGTTNLLFPNFGYKQQVTLGIYAMLYSSLNSDTNIINLMRIWTPGGTEEVSVPEAQRVYFQNPLTGLTYIARKYGTDPALTAIRGGTAVDGGVASRMLAHANALLVDAYLTDGNNPDGTPHLLLDTNGRPRARNTMSPQAQARAERAFTYYVGLIDAMRNISRYLGYGHL